MICAYLGRSVLSLGEEQGRPVNYDVTLGSVGGVGIIEEENEISVGYIIWNFILLFMGRYLHKTNKIDDKVNYGNWAFARQFSAGSIFFYIGIFVPVFPLNSLCVLQALILIQFSRLHGCELNFIKLGWLF